MHRITLVLVLLMLIAVPQAYAYRFSGKVIEADCALLTAHNYCPLYFSIQDSSGKVYYCTVEETTFSNRLRFKLKVWMLTAKALGEDIEVQYTTKRNEDNEEIFVADYITVHGRRYPN